MGIAIFDNIFVILSINICRRCFLQQRRKVRLTLFYDGTHPSVTFPRIGGQSCRWAANDNIGNSPRAAIVVGGRAGRACIRPEARRAYGAATTRAGPAVIRRLRPSVHRSLRLSDRPSRVASRRETVGSIVTACDSDRRRAMCWQLAVLPQWDALDTWLRLVYYRNYEDGPHYTYSPPLVLLVFFVSKSTSSYLITFTDPSFSLILTLELKCFT